MVWAVSAGRADFARSGLHMISKSAERIPSESRLRSKAEFTQLKAHGRPARGRHCLVVFEARPGEPTQVAFVASRKGVGGAVERNRARRRMREIVRRRWPRVAPFGVRMMFVAFRSLPRAAHADLVEDIERLLVEAGAMTAESLTS
ncbi:MAG TPA: ribonuclease P protein component [Candidatus Eisenbacteria bacterium]|nr:ribonuclease P protein component [Candidatus Eisenbacteria bacterium]